MEPASVNFGLCFFLKFGDSFSRELLNIRRVEYIYYAVVINICNI